MESFNICVKMEINGALQNVGKISGTSFNDACFIYDEAYLRCPQSHAISISLPLSKKAFSPKETRNYFEGFLPGGFNRKYLINSLQIDNNDYISLLKNFSNEYLGAIKISNESTEEDFDYKLIDLGELDFQESNKSNFSLSGACRKVNLYYDEKNNKWYLPGGGAPGNYIIKRCNDSYENQIINEQLCLITAQKLGIEIPASFIIKNENKQNPTFLFASKRYDCYSDANSKFVENLSVPYRLHQEDFSQVLGINLSEKYEPEGKHYLKLIFDILRLYSSNPIKDQKAFWKMCIFNYFIGNTDNHIKNYSLVYSKDLSSVKLAPFYDVMSTLIYENVTRKMAFRINQKTNIDEITREDFKKESKLIDLDEEFALQAFDELQMNFKNALLQSEEELVANGFFQAKEIAERIIQLQFFNKYKL